MNTTKCDEAKCRRLSHDWTVSEPAGQWTVSSVALPVSKLNHWSTCQLYLLVSWPLKTVDWFSWPCAQVTRRQLHWYRSSVGCKSLLSNSAICRLATDHTILIHLLTYLFFAFYLTGLFSGLYPGQVGSRRSAKEPFAVLVCYCRPDGLPFTQPTMQIYFRKTTDCIISFIWNII